jgi:hypothetical protein
MKSHLSQILEDPASDEICFIYDWSHKILNYQMAKLNPPPVKRLSGKITLMKSSWLFFSSLACCYLFF